MPTALPVLKEPSRVNLRRWSRERNLPALLAVVNDGTLAERSSIIAVQSAQRGGWLDALNLLWDRSVLPPTKFLSVAWKDLAMGTWSGVAREDAVSIEPWLVEKTWGPASNHDHALAQAKGGVYALRSAWDMRVERRWTLAIANGTRVDNTAGVRLLETVLSAHLDKHPDRQQRFPLTGWRRQAFVDLLDGKVPLNVDTMVRLFCESEDDLFEKALSYAPQAWSQHQRTIALAKAGLLSQREVLAKDPQRRQRFFDVLLSHGLESSLLFTADAVSRSSDFDRGGHLLASSGAGRWNGVGIDALMSLRGDFTEQFFYVADHWWPHTSRPPVDLDQKKANRDRLYTTIDVPRLRAQLTDAIEEVNVLPTSVTPRRSRL